jgi:hypothetical protein
MVIKQQTQLMLESKYGQHGGRRFFEYALGYFSSAIDDLTAKFLTELVHALASPGYRPLIGLSPFYEARWQSVTKGGWTTLTEQPENHTRWKILRRAWVVGYAHERDKFSEIYQYGWNYGSEEALIVGVAHEDDNGELLAEAARQGHVYPDHEPPLLSRYPTIVNRYYDGLWLRVLSTTFTPVEMQKLIANASTITISLPVVTMERSRWPSR